MFEKNHKLFIFLWLIFLFSCGNDTNEMGKNEVLLKNWLPGSAEILSTDLAIDVHFSRYSFTSAAPNYSGEMFLSELTEFEKMYVGVKSPFYVTNPETYSSGFISYEKRVIIYEDLIEDLITRPDLNDKEQDVGILFGILGSDDLNSFVGITGDDVEYLQLTTAAIAAIATKIDQHPAAIRLTTVKNQLNSLEPIISKMEKVVKLGTTAKEALVYFLLFNSDIETRLVAFENKINTVVDLDPAIREAFCGTSSEECNGGIKNELETKLEDKDSLTLLLQTMAEDLIGEHLKEAVEVPWTAVPNFLCKLPLMKKTASTTFICSSLSFLSETLSGARKLLNMKIDMAASGTMINDLFDNQYVDLTGLNFISQEDYQKWEMAKLQLYLAHRYADVGLRVSDFKEGGKFVEVMNDLYRDPITVASQEDELREMKKNFRHWYFYADTLLKDAIENLPPPVADLSLKNQFPRAGRELVFDASSSYDLGGTNYSNYSSALKPTYIWEIDDLALSDSSEKIKKTFSVGGIHKVKLTVVSKSGARSSEEIEFDLKARVNDLDLKASGTDFKFPEDLSFLNWNKWDKYIEISTGETIPITARADIQGEGWQDIVNDIDWFVVGKKYLQYDFTNKRFDVPQLGSAVAMAVWEGTIVGYFRVNSKFGDVPEKAWFTEYIQNLVDRGVIEGYSDGTFKPAQNINRAEYIKMVVKTVQCNQPAGWINAPDQIANPYSDVDKSDWFYEPVMLALINGIIDSDTAFRPADNLNRAEAAKTINLAFDIDAPTPLSPKFTDVPPGEWYSTYVYKAAYNKIVGGYPNNTFKPSESINRAEAAKMVWLSYEYAKNKEVN